MELVAIKYVGAKERRRDNVADTGLVWLAGETHYVEPEAAKLLLAHPDIWEVDRRAKAKSTEAIALPKAVKEVDQEPRSALPPLTAMNKAALAQLAMTRFGQTFDQKMKVDEMRATLVALENGGAQRGS
mgnify:CR=1 FL=1